MPEDDVSKAATRVVGAFDQVRLLIDRTPHAGNPAWQHLEDVVGGLRTLLDEQRVQAVLRAVERFVLDYGEHCYAVGAAETPEDTALFFGTKAECYREGVADIRARLTQLVQER